MSDNSKPWQRNVGNSIPSINNNRSNLLNTNLSHQLINNNNNNKPPLPPRANQSYSPASAPPSFMNGSSPYGYGLGSFSAGYSPYCRPYGMGMGGYGGFSNNQGFGGESSFVRDAEESTRTAFSAIETMVYAVGSVSMMLESTYFALYNSFKAILGVADHFARLKTNLWAIISSLTLLQKIQNWINRLLVLLKFRSPLHSAEHNSVWEVHSTNSAEITSVEQLTPDASTNIWPFVTYISIIIGIPWILWRIVKMLRPSGRAGDNAWSEGRDEHVLLRANYSFAADSNSEISMEAGDVLIAAPKNKQPMVKGWLLASNQGKIGLIPANYVSVLGVKRPEMQDPNLPASSLNQDFISSNISND